MAITDAGREPDLVAEFLEKHWRICEPAVRTDLGVSRITWRVGQRYWLCQSEQRRSAALLCQAQLLQRLRCFLEDEHLSISVPEIVASESGGLIVADCGYGWCIAVSGVFSVFIGGYRTLLSEI
jgi:hypothetical protein